jgi:hypothetical protein
LSSFGYTVIPRDSRSDIFVTITLIAIAIGSVGRVRSVTGVTCVVAGGPNAQVLSIAIGSVTGVTVVVAGGPSAHVATSRIAGVTRVVNSVGSVRGVGSVGSVGSVAGVTIVVAIVRSVGRVGRVTGVTTVGGTNVQVVNVASRDIGLARLANVVGGSSVQITNKVRAKPLALSDRRKLHPHWCGISYCNSDTGKERRENK